MTPLGEFLVEQLMQRGMIIEIDHMPRQTYKRVFEILDENDYPAAGTHGLNNGGELYRLGGVSKSGFGRCRDPEASATVDDGYQARIDLIEDNGGFPAEGFGFDFNGFAGAPGPRFGPNSVCGAVPQDDPVTYPFESYAGDVTFTQPQLGNRTVDFNTEGMAHIGLLPELIDEVRRDGVSDVELEPLFKSAEGYIRMWEKAERRAGIGRETNWRGRGGRSHRPRTGRPG
jgi:microsomal dipeptidase-like Zn-dependent dipeptidase